MKLRKSRKTSENLKKYKITKTTRKTDHAYIGPNFFLFLFFYSKITILRTVMKSWNNKEQYNRGNKPMGNKLNQ